MSPRRGFTLAEVVVAVVVLLAFVHGAARAGTALLAVDADTVRWRRAAVDVQELLRRFELAPCEAPSDGRVTFPVGPVEFRWTVDGAGGHLVATGWPDGAPSAVRRGALRSDLPCR